MSFHTKSAPIRRFLVSPWGIALLIALGWQLCMTLFGVLASLTFNVNVPEDARGILSHTAHWDSGWYLDIIAHDFYKVNGASPVFYPLFPLAVNTLLTISFGLIPILVAGLIVNTFSLWFALVALLKISEFYVDQKNRWWIVALFITSPAAIFLHLFYAEALFCAIVFWAYLFALRRQWHFMGIMLAFATAAKLPAILFVGLCGLEFMRAYDWNIKKILNKNLLWFLLAPLGVIAYGTYLYFIRGDFLAMAHGYKATDDWSYHVFNPNFIDTLLKSADVSLLLLSSKISFDPGIFVNHVLPLAGLVITGLCSLYAIYYIKKKTLPLAIFGLASIVFFSINSNIISVHRYLLTSLVIYLVAILFMERFKQAKLLLYAVMFVGVILQFYLLILFVSSRFAG